MIIELATALKVTKADSEFADMLNEVVEAVNSLIHISSSYRFISDFTLGEDSIRIENHTFACGQKVANALADSRCLAVFATTIGKGVSDLYAQYMGESDYLSAYWCDLLANHAVNIAMENLKETIRNSHTDSLITSNWGPGYCGWALTDQRELLALLPDDSRCVELTDSMLMQPTKSLSGIIGIGKDVVYHKSGCADCMLKDCAYKSIRS